MGREEEATGERDLPRRLVMTPGEGDRRCVCLVDADGTVDTSFIWNAGVTVASLASLLVLLPLLLISSSGEMGMRFSTFMADTVILLLIVLDCS